MKLINEDIKKHIFESTKCNSIYNSLVITHKKISNCCCTPPIKIINDEVNIKENFLSCEKCLNKNKYNKINSKKIIFLDIIPFYKCNAECSICDIYNTIEKREDFLNLKKLEEYDFSNLKELTISGGEIFLEEEYIISLLKYFKKDIKLILITNGTIYSEKILKELETFKEKELIISLDGFEENNIKVRKNCNYFKIKENIEKIKKNFNLIIKINFTISKFNYKNLEDIKKIENDLSLIVQTPFLIEPKDFSLYELDNVSELKKILNKNISKEIKKEILKIIRGKNE